MSDRVGILHFSPTGTTAQVCRAIAAGAGAANPEIFDITNPILRSRILSQPERVLSGIEQLIVGVPVYFGKIPIQASEVLSSLHGDGKDATAVVVYGNRDYGIALHSMAKILIDRGFCVTRAGAFIGQHSYSDVVPVAVGRPDRSDLDIAYKLGATSSNSPGGLSLEQIPVQQDMISRSNVYLPLKPVFKSDICSGCGECMEACPMGILSDSGFYVSEEADKNCIGCMACVRTCASEARVAERGVAMRMTIKYILRRAKVERNEPLVLLS